jgi:hypothetical protein
MAQSATDNGWEGQSLAPSTLARDSQVTIQQQPSQGARITCPITTWKIAGSNATNVIFTRFT